MVHISSSVVPEDVGGDAWKTQQRAMASIALCVDQNLSLQPEHAALATAGHSTAARSETDSATRVLPERSSVSIHYIDY